MNDLLNYVEQLKIQDPSSAFPTEVGFRSKGGVSDAIDQSFVEGKSIVSFVSGVNLQSRQDILDSILLAQLAANKAFPNENDIIQWYQKFIEVFTTIGWVVEGREIETFKSQMGVYKIADAIIEILTAAFGSSIIPIVLKTLEAIKGISNNEHKIIAFEKNTHTQKNGAFQIAVAVENNNTVSLKLGTFVIQSKQEILQILFFSSQRDQTTLEYFSKQATLNAARYASIREAVSTKIESKQAEYVGELSI